MQQQFDLLLFLASNGILIYWCVLVFRNHGKKTLGLRLTGKQINILVVLEVVLFAAMYINYEVNKSPEIADSFAWHNVIIYARGVLPLAALAAINDKVFTFKNPVFSTLPIALIVDYILLWLCSRIADLVKAKKAKAHI